ncbi:hypothetical protein AMTR_s00103p00054550 [Amborella trichopoda]|uniref:Uncharacterized protein n=1 Tax=Amborella trichopoda TaxID=13333 RepID=W1P1J9_AMBTC|nr:hypothetical protein AMTR_s00103p00054550 [Amborella trichopoda]
MSCKCLVYVNIAGLAKYITSSIQTQTNQAPYGFHVPFKFNEAIPIFLAFSIQKGLMQSC